MALDFLPDLSLLRLPALLDFFELWLDFLLLTAPLFLLLALLLLAVLTEDLPPRLDFFGLVQHSRYRAKRVHKRTTRAQMPAKMTVVGGPEVVPRICLEIVKTFRKMETLKKTVHLNLALDVLAHQPLLLLFQLLVQTGPVLVADAEEDVVAHVGGNLRLGQPGEDLIDEEGVNQFADEPAAPGVI